MDCITLTGTVIHGHQLGRRLGYPTANLDPATLTGELPATGVYAAHCLLPDGGTYWAMVNVGYRPTVTEGSEKELSVEAHLIDYTGDLYGQALRLTLLSRIRDERRMHSLEELAEQLTLDLKEVRRAAADSPR